MWLGGAKDIGGCQVKLFNDLHNEVRRAAPRSHLSCSLRSRLERVVDRSPLVSQLKDGCSPLFLACKKGNVEIVEYLVTACMADLEQKGTYEVPDDRTVHLVSPLWCASVAGKHEVVAALITHGADVNSVSDSGSTPVRSACFMTHIDIVRLLVENKADIHRGNHNGGTCLINSVQSVELCKFLLEHGADVNAQDIQNKTALHYAIQEHRFETTKLLLEYGADPFTLSRYQDDALQTACLKGASEIFEHLLDTVVYPPERLASAFELIGSTFLDEHHNTQKALEYWRAACDIRQKFGLDPPGLPAPQHGAAAPSDQASVDATSSRSASSGLLPQWVFGGTREFRSRQELEQMALDLDELRAQSLRICHRILGPSHKDLIYRLMYRGAAYADSLQYQHCIDLWRYALELRLAKDSVLYCDTCFTAQALVKLYLDLYEKNGHVNGVNGHQGAPQPAIGGRHPEQPQQRQMQQQQQRHQQQQQRQLQQQQVRLSDVLDTVELLVRDLPEAWACLQELPMHKRQQDSYNKVLKVIAHLLHLVACLVPPPGNNDRLQGRAAGGLPGGRRSINGLQASGSFAQQQHTVRLGRNRKRGAADSCPLEDEEWASAQVGLDVRKRVHRIVRQIDPRTTAGDSLLHLCCMKGNFLRGQTLFEEMDISFFPSVPLVKLLVECGAKINALNLAANTPLHTASIPANFNQEIVEILLDNGAHIDTRNSQNQRPVDMLSLNFECKINPLQYTTLKCLAARVISEHKLPFKREIPCILEDFVEAH